MINAGKVLFNVSKMGGARKVWVLCKSGQIRWIACEEEGICNVSSTFYAPELKPISSV